MEMDPAEGSCVEGYQWYTVHSRVGVGEGMIDIRKPVKREPSQKPKE